MHYRNIAIPELIDLMTEKEIHLFDARSDDHFDQAHMPGARLLTDAALKSLIVNRKNANPIVVYCYHGVSSIGLCQLISGLGFSQVYNLEGGWEAWQKHTAQAA